MLKKYLPLFFICCLVFGSCFHKKKPSYVLPEKTLVSVLIDIHLSLAITNENTIDEFTSNVDGAEINSWIWEKHNISKVDFDTTIAWYSQYPKEMSKIYRKAISHYTKLNDELKESPREDSTIFEIKTPITVKDGIKSSSTSGTVESIGVGRYYFNVEAIVNLSDQSVTPRVVFYIEGEDLEEVATNRNNFRQYIKDGRKRTYNVSFTCREKAGTPLHYELVYTPNKKSLKSSDIEIIQCKLTYRP